MNIHKHGKKWSINYRDKSGKSKRISFETEEAAKMWASAMTTIKQPKAVNATSDYKAGIDSFMAFRLGNRRPLTIRNVRSILELALPNIGMPNPTKETIYSYCLARQYRSSTARAIVKWIKAYFHYHKLPNDIEWKDLRKALEKEDKKPKRFFTEEEFKKLISVCPLWYQTVFKFMSSNGLRIFELSRLEYNAINWTTWEVTLPENQSKAKKERTSIVPQELREDFTKCFPPLGHGHLIHRGDGVKISPVGLGGRFKHQWHCSNTNVISHAI